MSDADFRLLLGMAFGCLWGVGVSQAVAAWVAGGNGWPWLAVSLVAALVVAMTARHARRGHL